MEEDLKQLSQEALLERARRTAAVERRVTAKMLKLLQEIERRRLYATLGYKSLFDFSVRELNYSESSAWRRISAMRLMKDVPEVCEKIATGKMSLSTASTVQKFLYHGTRVEHRDFNREAKRELVESLENKNSKEAEALLTGIFPNAIPQERTRVLTPDHAEIKFVADKPLYEKLERLKDLNSHRDPTRGYRPLFDWISDIALEELDPMHPSRHRRLTVAPPPSAPTRRSIPVALKRAVWKRDDGRCAYVHAATGRRCGSTRFLEIDHVKPFGIGGETTFENLRLYCRNHNQRAAARTYGESKLRAKHDEAKEAAPEPPEILH